MQPHYIQYFSCIVVVPQISIKMDSVCAKVNHRKGRPQLYV